MDESRWPDYTALELFLFWIIVLLICTIVGVQTSLYSRNQTLKLMHEYCTWRETHEWEAPDLTQLERPK